MHTVALHTLRLPPPLVKNLQERGSDKIKRVRYTFYMNKTNGPNNPVKKAIVLFAIADQKEQDAFREIVKQRNLPYILLFPKTIHNVEELLGAYDVDIIITDIHFQNGGFADWLILWPQPFILVFNYADRHMIDEMVHNENSDFILRDEAGRYLEMIPHRIRKILNYDESIQRHNKHLQATERRYLDLVQSLPDIIYSLDDEGNFNFINESIKSIGYEPFELLGKHFSSILDPEDVPTVSREYVLPSLSGVITGDEAAPKLFDERRTGERKTSGLEVKILPGPHISESSHKLVGSITAYGEVSAVGFSDKNLPDGYGSVGIIRDITSRKQHEQLLEKSLAEKEVLLKEIHHRVKNNLQVISSLLSLQSNYFENENDYRLYQDTQMQVQSMALVHEQLYQSDDISSIDMSIYLHHLCDALFDIYHYGKQIKYHVDAREIFLEPDIATPLALLTAELVSNSLKHAFPEDREGKIMIHLEEHEQFHYKLTVEDNGVGFTHDEQDKNGLGMILIKSLTEQLHGTLTKSGNSGTSFCIDFVTTLA